MKDLVNRDSWPGDRHDLPTSDELVKRIRKLRWIGLDTEAQALTDQLRQVPNEDCVPAA